MPLNEFGLIEAIKKYQHLSSRVVKGIGDDAAVLELDAKRYQLLTTDMLVEGVHFLRTAPAKLVGYKALACNISDIAAMGGVPTFAVVSIGLPLKTSKAYVKDLYTGMSALAKKFGVSIVGGDTVKADKVVINIALLGEVEKKNLVLRSGARPGDIIFVSGSLGNTLKSGKHLKFVPRVKEARFLVENFRLTSMMDISDGLAGDLGHILKASAVGAILDASMIPRNPGASVEPALCGGEDFELLVTLSFTQAKKLIEYQARNEAFRFYPVGEVTAAVNKLQLRDDRGKLRSLSARAYTHF